MPSLKIILVHLFAHTSLLLLKREKRNSNFPHPTESDPYIGYYFLFWVGMQPADGTERNIRYSCGTWQDPHHGLSMVGWQGGVCPASDTVLPRPAARKASLPQASSRTQGRPVSLQREAGAATGRSSQLGQCTARPVSNSIPETEHPGGDFCELLVSMVRCAVVSGFPAHVVDGV